MLTRFLKDDINGIRAPQFQRTYTCNTNHPSLKNLVKLCHEVHNILWVNLELGL